MAVRIQTDQTLYLYEDEGDTIFPSTGDWSILWMYRHESDLNLASLLAVLYGDVAATIYCGAYVGADGVTVTLRGANGGGETTSAQPFVLEVGREYRFGLVHDSVADTVTLHNDGVPVLSMAFSPAAGDTGFRSLHFAGFGGSPAGHLDSTWARMRIWTAVLTEAEQKAEFRSFTPVRTDDLVNDWPMIPGSDRFDPASGTTQVLKIHPSTSIVDGAGFLAGPAEPIYRDSVSGGDSSLSSPTISVPDPGAEEGDLEVLWISAGVLSSSGAAPTIATPSGWELRGTGGSVPVVGGAVNTRVHLFTRLAPSSNGSVVCDAGVNAVFAYARLSYPNPDSAAPFGQVTFGSGGPSTSAILSALTTGRPKSLLSSFITQGAAQSITPPADMVEREDNATSGCSSHDRIQPAAGSSGTKTFTLPGSTDFAWGFAEFYAERGDTIDSGNNTAQSSWAVSTPALAAGDLITVNLAWDDSTTISSVTAPAGPNGETAVSIAGPVASASTEVRAQAWRYIATDDWDAGTLAFAPVGGSEQWTATVLKVPAGEFDAATPIGAASTRASSGTAETSALSPAFSAGSTDGGGRLIAWLAADDDPFTTDAGAWTRLANVDRGAVAALLAQRDLPTEDSESLTAGSWSIAGDSWCSLAYVIRGLSSDPTTYTLTTSLAMAVQLARSASASVAVPVQEGKTAGTAVAMALQESRTAQAQIAAAVSQARAASMVLSLGVQAAAEAGFSAGLAVQQAMAAAAAVDLAVSRAESASASVALQVQAAAEASASVDLMVQSGASQSVSAAVLIQELKQAAQDVALAVQQAHTVAMSLTTAVQTQRDAGVSIGLAALLARSAGASVDLQVQDGAMAALAVQATVQFARQASASLSAAVAAVVTAGTSVRAAVSLQHTLGAAMTAAISARGASGVSASLYVLTDEPPTDYVRAPAGIGYSRPRLNTSRPSTGDTTRAVHGGTARPIR